jgi:hypothetical protein
MNCSLFRLLSLSVLLVLLAAACSGGESGTGFGGSHPKVAVGVLTGFGSVYVNGIEYDTSDAEINVNESIASEQELAIGQVVTVVGSTNPSNTDGKADAIYYESEVCGIVIQNDQAGLMNILGQTIEYDSETVFDSAVESVNTIVEIPVSAVVDVSGYRTSDNTLHATHIELLYSDYSMGEQLTVNGVVTAGLSSGKFSLGDLTVVVDGLTDMSKLPNSQINPGMEIKVKSNRGLLNNELLADSVQLDKKEYITTGSSFEVEGIVMSPDLQAKEFVLNGYTVIFSAQTKFVGGAEADLADGVKAVVEGILQSDDELEAKTIVFRNKAKIDLIAPVSAINTADNQVNLSGVVVQLTNRTLLKDDDKTTNVKRFSLADLGIGDKVKIKAFQDNLSMDIIAIQFRRVEAGSVDTSFEITGVLDAVTNEQVIISGVKVDNIGLSPDPNPDSVGTVVTYLGTVPITTQ